MNFTHVLFCAMYVKYIIIMLTTLSYVFSGIAVYMYFYKIYKHFLLPSRPSFDFGSFAKRIYADVIIIVGDVKYICIS